MVCGTLEQTAIARIPVRIATLYVRKPPRFSLERKLGSVLGIIATTCTTLPQTVSHTLSLGTRTKIANTSPVCGGKPLLILETTFPLKFARNAPQTFKSC